MNAESGSASSGRPMRKCPGVRASMPSSSLVRGTRGLLLRGFNLSECSGEFLEGKLHIAENTSQMSFHALDSSLPEATEVRGMLWNELPFYVTNREENSHSILSLLFS